MDPAQPAVPEVLGLPLNRESVHRLHETGLLTAEARDAALDRIRWRPDWPPWLRLRLLCLGSALLLTGIVFFFAYNWASLGRFAKLGIVQGGLVAALAGAWAVGSDRLTGRLLLLAANLMVGVALAVVGQVYQTGADAWELFAAWAAFTFLWALFSNFAAHWILWLAVTHAAIILWWEQSVGAPVSGLCLVLAGLDVTALAAREIAVRRGLLWASGSWVREILWMAVLTSLTIPPCILILEGPAKYDGGGAVLPGAAAWAVALLVGRSYFRSRARDLGPLIFAATSFSVVILTLIGKLIFERSTDAGAFLVFGVAALLVVGISAAALWKSHLAMEKELHG